MTNLAVLAEWVVRGGSWGAMRSVVFKKIFLRSTPSINITSNPNVSRATVPLNHWIPICDSMLSSKHQKENKKENANY